MKEERERGERDKERQGETERERERNRDRERERHREVGERQTKKEKRTDPIHCRYDNRSKVLDQTTTIAPRIAMDLAIQPTHYYSHCLRPEPSNDDAQQPKMERILCPSVRPKIY